MTPQQEPLSDCMLVIRHLIRSTTMPTDAVTREAATRILAYGNSVIETQTSDAPETADENPVSVPAHEVPPTAIIMGKNRELRTLEAKIEVLDGDEKAEAELARDILKEEIETILGNSGHGTSR